MEGETEAMAIAHDDDDELGSSSAAVPMAVASVDTAEGSLDSAEEKRLKRMRRNRESAAMSRNRKKQYVEELEARVAALNETVQSLHSENFELRREHARLQGKPMPTAPTAVAVMAPVIMGDGEGAPTEDDADDDVVDHPATLPSSAGGVAPSPRASDALLGLELLSRSASIGGDGTNKHDSGSVGGDECQGLVAAEAAVAVADAGDAIPIAAVEPAVSYTVAPDDEGSASHPASDAASHPPSDSSATVGSASVEAI